MSDVHDRLRRLLAGDTFTWPQVLALLHQVGESPIDESQEVLRDVARFNGSLAIDPADGLPHAMPPEAVLRSFALQRLGGWDSARHRDVIQEVADEGHAHISGVARALLRTDG